MFFFQSGELSSIQSVEAQPFVCSLQRLVDHKENTGPALNVFTSQADFWSQRLVGHRPNIQLWTFFECYEMRAGPPRDDWCFRQRLKSS